MLHHNIKTFDHSLKTRFKAICTHLRNLRIFTTDPKPFPFEQFVSSFLITVAFFNVPKFGTWLSGVFRSSEELTGCGLGLEERKDAIRTKGDVTWAFSLCLVSGFRAFYLGS